MANPTSQSRSFWPILTLIVAATVLNYVDRGSLSLAAPLLKTEWGLTSTQLGILLSSFFWTYTLLQVPVGWLSDRMNASVVLGTGFLLWSLATAGSALAVGVGTLLAMRLFLGVGESVMFPAASKIFALHVPEESRGVANALMTAAMRWGVAVGTLGGGLLIARYSWRTTFLIIGLGSLVWLPAWVYWRPRGAPTEELHRIALPSFGAILRQRAFWCAGFGHFCANYLVYFMLTWLPTYLVQERHESIVTMTTLVSTIWAADSLSTVATGWLTDLAIRSGVSTTRARKTASGIGYTWASIALAAMAFSGPRSYVWCLLAVAVGCGFSNAGTFAIGQTLAGPRAAGKWIGMQNCIGNMAGVIGPALTGWLVDRTGNFRVAFAVASGVTVLGFFSWIVGVRKIEPVDWGVANAEPGSPVVTPY